MTLYTYHWHFYVAPVVFIEIYVTSGRTITYDIFTAQVE